MKKWTINIPIYNYDVEIIYDEDMYKLVDYVSQSYFITPTYEGSLDNYDALTWPLDGGQAIITTTTLDQFVLLHECVHVIWNLGKACGINDEEFFAYTLQYLFKQLMQYIND